MFHVTTLEWAHPLLVPGGGVAIVAIGRAKWVMRELESEPGIQQRRLEVGVSWSADHRIIEGAQLSFTSMGVMH